MTLTITRVRNMRIEAIDASFLAFLLLSLSLSLSLSSLLSCSFSIFNKFTLLWADYPAFKAVFIFGADPTIRLGLVLSLWPMVIGAAQNRRNFR
jgi:hypothetical protein